MPIAAPVTFGSVSAIISGFISGIVNAWAKVRQMQMNKLTLPTTQPSSAAILRVTRIFWFRVRLCVSHFSSDLRSPGSFVNEPKPYAMPPFRHDEKVVQSQFPPPVRLPFRP